MKTPKTLKDACRLLRARVRYVDAGFNVPDDSFLGKDVTQSIKDATSLYVESWIVPLIDHIEKGDMAMLARSTQINSTRHAIDLPWPPKKEEKDDQLVEHSGNRAVWESQSKQDRIVTCVYCGKEYPQDTPTCGAGVEVLTEHIKVCPNHPMRKAEERIRELEEKNKALREELFKGGHRQ